jgi:hypothetical protein
VPARGARAEHDAKGEAHDRGEEGDLQRRPDRGKKLARDRSPGEDRDPEVAAQDLREPKAVLHPDRLVEAVDPLDLGHRGRRGVVADQHVDRRAGHEMHQREDEERYAEEDRQRVQQPAQNEGEQA